MPNVVVHDTIISVSVIPKQQLNVVVQNKPSPSVSVSVGMRGESGSKPIYTAIADTPLSGQRAIAQIDGSLVYADSSNITHLKSVIGITIGAASIGFNASIQTYGLISEPTWDFDVNKPILLGLNGQLVQDIPNESLFYLQIGKPLTSKSMVISIQVPYIM